MQHWQKGRLGLVLILLSLPAQSCVLSAPVAVEATVTGSVHNAEPRTVTISNNNVLMLPQASGVLELRDAQTKALLDRIESWPLADGQIAAINTAPVVLDSNFDGAADAIYALDSAGLLWFSQLSASGFRQLKLVADLSGQGFIFDQPMLLLQTQLSDLTGNPKPVTLLLITAETADGNHSLIALKHQALSQQLIRFDSLVDRNTIDEDEYRYGIDERLWEQIRQQSGWISRLPGRITVVPQVYAGVVYVTTAPAAAVKVDCSLEEDTELMLSALHLHHAGLVYAKRAFSVAPLNAAQLTLAENASGDFALMLDNGDEQQTLLTEVVSISEECADCTTVLQQQAFPKVIRLATFQLEDGAH